MHLHTLRRESRQKETEPNILTRCVGQKPILSAKPSPLPRVTGAPAPIGKNIHLTVPFLRRGFTPRFSVLARKSPCEPCSCMSYSFYVIMNLFAEFVKPFTQKKQKRKHRFSGAQNFPQNPCPFTKICYNIFYAKAAFDKKQKVIL